METPRKTVRWVAAALAVLALAAVAFWLSRGTEGFLTGIYPVDDRRAAFLMRFNGEDETRAWVGLVDREDGVQWEHELPGTTFGTYAGHGLTVSDKMVTVQWSDEETASGVMAFGTADGELLWRSDLAFSSDKPADRLQMTPGILGARPYADERIVLYAEDDLATRQLVARSPSTGEVLWKHRLAAVAIRALIVTDRWIALRVDAQWHLIGRKDGKVGANLDVYSDACVDDDRFVGWSRAGLTVVDLPASGAPSKPRVVAIESEGSPLGKGFAETCGRRGADFVFLRSVTGIQRTHELVALSGLGDAHGPSVKWRLSLGSWGLKRIGGARDTENTQSHPLRGDTARFVPLILSDHLGDGIKVALFDLAQGVRVWQGEPRDELLHHWVFRGAGWMHYLVRTGHLVAFDGATGKATAARAFGGLEDTRGFYAQDDLLWVYSMRWSSMNALPWAALDRRTLEVRSGAKLESRGAAAETVSRLGIPSEVLDGL